MVLCRHSLSLKHEIDHVNTLQYFFNTMQLSLEVIVEMCNFRLNCYNYYNVRSATDQFIKAYFIEYTCMSRCSVNNDLTEWFCELISHYKLECHYLLMCVLQTSWSSAQFKYFTKFIVISHRHWGFHNVYVISTTIWQRSIAFCCCKYPK